MHTTAEISFVFRHHFYVDQMWGQVKGITSVEHPFSFAKTLLQFTGSLPIGPYIHYLIYMLKDKGSAASTPAESVEQR